MKDLKDQLLDLYIKFKNKLDKPIYLIWYDDDEKTFQISKESVYDISTRKIWLNENFEFPLESIGKELFFYNEEAEAYLKNKPTVVAKQ